MKTLATITGMLLIIPALWGQSPEQDPQELVRTAISLMDGGDPDQALEYLARAKELRPNDLLIDYETAFAYQIKKDHKKVIKITKKLIKQGYPDPKVYQMLGNNYDFAGMPEKAIKTYEAGIKKHPNAGNLYLERGNMDYARENYNQALDFYLEGIEQDPLYPSCYRSSAILIMAGAEKELWGLIYGEVFQNLEVDSRRADYISEVMYKVMQGEITFEETDSTTNIHVGLTGKIVLNLEDMLNGEEFKLPFEAVFEIELMKAMITSNRIDLESLYQIREQFIQIWAEAGHLDEYDIPLFRYQYEIFKAGHFEAYNYYIFRGGDPEGFDQWLLAHKDEFRAFAEYYEEHTIHHFLK
ncbi:tetratricopeptide repeat protein [Pontibacter sp. G13]|uniref:tetratricopeptide repeat protein n=1 Tax=Pontibacter sp. G13 TaxID=3074898 RepID=UPI00288AE290|nr:tetratricopeptide repeat protein [Pontibacter sp. G13]WNJ18438.1 tetratricopeptide repeat protein [Pontibacter sp. G13]